MAAAIIPVVAGLIPTFVPLVVKLLDKIFPPKSGPSKADAATEIVAAIQQGLVNSKATAAVPLSGDQIKASVQNVVDVLNAQGQLRGAATVIDAASPAIVGLADLLIHIGTTMKGGIQ